MLKLFDRYLIREIYPPFLVGLLLVSFVILMNQIFLLADLLISKGITLKTAIEIIVYLIPAVLAFSIPMAVLIGVLAGLSRLSSDSEIVAFKTLGVSYKRFFLPVLTFSLLGWAVSSFFTLYLAPRANYKWVQTLTNSVLTKVQFKINPREFNEMIPNTVIFIQDITHEREWKNIFVYSSEDAGEPKVIMAQEGRIHFYPESKRATVQLFHGAVHSYPLDKPEEYRLTSFEELEQEVNIEKLFQTLAQRKRVREKDIAELFRGLRTIRMNLEELRLKRAQLLHSGAETPELAEVENTIMNRKAERTHHWIEVHKKFAFPLACLIFGFLALPLGTSTRKGGRTSGFTVSLAVILLYYVLLTSGEAWATEGKFSPFLGIWGANIFIFLAACYLNLVSMRESGFFLRFSRLLKRHKKERPPAPKKQKRHSAPRPFLSLTFPNILDRYVIRKYAFIFSIIFLSITLIFVVVTFLERVDDALESKRPVSLIFKEIVYDLPSFIHQNILPTSILAATLLTLGIMTKFNEITAMKACGISIYRIVMPVLLIGLAASIFSFYLQENILPYANRKREEIWNKLKGLPARSYTYLDRRWVLGREKDRIYHYSYFDPKEASFSNLLIFDLDLSSWSLERRYFSPKGYLSGESLALTSCWERDFSQGVLAGFQRKEKLEVRVKEEKNFFLKEWKEPEQMSFGELRKYIRDIDLSGFDTVRFKVSLYFKTSFPFVSFIMTLFAIPFAFSMGKRGTLVGIGLSIAIAMVYWGMIGVCKSLGDIQFLPPLLAAWGPNIIFGFAGAYYLFSIRT